MRVVEVLWKVGEEGKRRHFRQWEEDHWLDYTRIDGGGL